MKYRNNQKVQKFRYRGIEYQYRILEASLRNYKLKTGKQILEQIRRGGEYTMRVFYYTICWCSSSVTEDEFIRDWRLGYVSFRTGSHKEYSPIEIGMLLRKAVLKYGIET